ncbi:hypothetical protein F4V73_11100 [Morganella psychrotolerans]|uniref:Uncharacterized protein n=1 Tax=Morganella psychrotolerans TaxID=368603 RepID=A0A5M9R5I8_9GAMM|nr:hypothetical protein F4V73_11100 [Morganella psychrotolerans]
MINRTFLRWFLTLVLIFVFYFGLALFDLAFNLEFTSRFSVISSENPINSWQAFVMSLLSLHNAAMSYVYLGTPILLVLLFVIHKKIR